RMSVLSRRVQLHDRFRLRVAGDSLSRDVDVAVARARGREVEDRATTGLRQREWARLVRGAVRGATEIPNRVPALRPEPSRVDVVAAPTSAPRRGDVQCV